MKIFDNIEVLATYFSRADFKDASDEITVGEHSYILAAHDTDKSEQLIYMSASKRIVEITESNAKITVEYFYENGTEVEPPFVIDVPLF